ncbi:ribonuclease H-like domain-containing protein [Candidatus Woesearchaeota archaeon]|jgi:uncharacterized protein|nr:ribonuclease H-like domain-containing protein [Candidatus Woesearchaeota archaeon]
MIENSFIIFDKIGSRFEQKLWDQGISNWSIFLKSDASQIKGISKKRKMFYDQKIKEAQLNLNLGELNYFKKLIKPSQIWRLYSSVSKKLLANKEILFLDIETSQYYGDITLIGVYDCEDYLALVKGKTLTEDYLKKAFDGKKIVISFNGKGFDFPVMKRYFQKNFEQVVHFDLRFACQQVGLVGGLKDIERQLEVSRKLPIEKMCLSPVDLWNSFISTGNQSYFEELILYNEDDVVNLKTILDLVIIKLEQKYLDMIG